MSKTEQDLKYKTEEPGMDEAKRAKRREHGRMEIRQNLRQREDTTITDFPRPVPSDADHAFQPQIYWVSKDVRGLEMAQSDSPRCGQCTQHESFPVLEPS